MKTVRTNAIVFGSLDSLSSGLCTANGVINSATEMAKLNPYGPIILLAALAGISSGINNALFSVRVGYHDFVQGLYPTQYEQIIDEERALYNDELNDTNNRHHSDHEEINEPEEIIEDNTIDSPKYFSDNPTVNTLFMPRNEACKLEEIQQINDDLNNHSQLRIV
jgi:hypothetical protein